MAKDPNDPCSLPTSVMEAKEDDSKMDINNLALITRPVRNRKQKKFEDFVTFRGHDKPPTSSTPIKRSDSKSYHSNELPGTSSNLFSPSSSTDLNITFNQSSMQVDDNGTSEIMCNQSSNQTWAENSHSVASGNKRKISEVDTSVDTPAPVKKKRGRPRKINSASTSMDQSSDLLTKEDVYNRLGDDKERAGETRFEENEQDMNHANIRLNETSSSFQEEDNPQRCGTEKKQGKSTYGRLMSEESHLIGRVKKTASEEEVCKPVIGTNVSLLPEKKRGRGRPRKPPKQINNNQMNDSPSSLPESHVMDCIPLNRNDALHGNDKVDAAGDLSNREIKGKSRGARQGSPSQEHVSFIHPNTVSGSDVKRHRGKPKRYSPTQFTDCLSTSQADDSVLQSSLCEEKASSYEDGHQSSQVEKPETDNSIVLTASASSSTVKRGRGRPPNVTVTKRGRGRPRKPGITSQDLSRVDGSDFQTESNEHHVNKNQQETTCSFRKRKFARRQSSDSESRSSDEKADNPMPSSRGRGRGQTSHARGRGRGNKSHKSMTPDNIKCIHCEMIIKCLRDYQYHLMSKHSLVYKPEEPQGINDPYFIVKKLGYVDCQQCGRRFKNPQYYGHHIFWCGRENEMFFCPICNRETKVMWQKQHNRMHTQQEEQKAQAEKRKEEELKRREEKEEEEQKDGTDGKTKRKAARSAMSMLNKMEMTDENTASSDEYGTISDAEDGDDDDDDEDDDDEDDEIEKDEDSLVQGKKERKSNSRRRDRVYSDRHNLWTKTCQLLGSIPQSEKLKHLYDYYNGAGQGKLFPELSPITENWKIMNSREREKYLPHLKQSSVVNSVHGKSNDSETFTLTVGGHRCVQGKAFCYTGGPIWAMDWCPRPVTSSQEQILAIASDNHPGHHLYVNTVAEVPNLLQLWSVRMEKESTEMSPRLDFCIAHNSGYVRSLSWCPQGCFDEIDSKNDKSISSQENVPSTLPRLGLLAVACSDATIPIFSIPHLSSIDCSIHSSSDHHKPIIVKPKPCIKLIPNSRNDATPCLSVSWQNSDGCERIIGGYGRGEVLMWSLACRSAGAQGDNKTVRPIRAFLRHRNAVVTCAWCPSLPDFFVSCDISGFIYFWNSNRPLSPESVLKKAGNLVTKSICMAGPVHWGFFTTNDKTRIPDLHCRNIDSYHVNFHGFSPQCPISVDFSTKVLMPYLCTWDVTFDPVFNVLVTCDAAGKVHVALLNMENLLARLRHRSYTFSSQTLQKVLYKLSVSPEVKDSKEKYSSLATTNGEEAETVQQQSEELKNEPTRANHSGNSSEGESSGPVHESETMSKENADENTGKECTSMTNKRNPNRVSQNEKTLSDVILRYQDSEVEKAELKLEGRKKKNRVENECSERENFSGSHIESIQRVRLCPGMDTNLWLASGGNGGILRFDRLYNLVNRFSKTIEREVNRLKQSTKTADS